MCKYIECNTVPLSAIEMEKNCLQIVMSSGKEDIGG